MPPVQLAGALADRRDVPLGDHCPIDRTLQVVGHRTSLLLLREVFYGARRFDALVKRTGMTEAVASQRLRGLVEAGLLTREPYREEGQRTRHEYVLTASGHAFLPVLVALIEWGQAHVPGARGELAISHADCGERVRLEVRCTAGHVVPEDELVVEGRRKL
ncbi:helix-turn-helix domain-containing protein [Nocardioides sp.]|uniref:winged helix-turn-helix transcriptional regulator n=1 Tax=Nocardioides sp. TaxID=35761 RepID=UPI002723FB0A|nr:helix-turn-helix domain-containing protein [Nocardioides sp.]MDO9457236.1 helix-turn-helix domain-containing protein [Nocardioides sp.]